MTLEIYAVFDTNDCPKRLKSYVDLSSFVLLFYLFYYYYFLNVFFNTDLEMRKIMQNINISMNEMK